MEARMTSYMEVDVRVKDAVDRLIKKLEKEYNLISGDFIVDGYLCRDVEYHTSHSWYRNERIREKNDNDEEVLDLIRNLRIATANIEGDFI